MGIALRVMIEALVVIARLGDSPERVYTDSILIGTRVLTASFLLPSDRTDRRFE
jgi:hypothetical protein